MVGWSSRSSRGSEALWGLSIVILLCGLIAVCHGADYTVTITKLRISTNCQHFDPDDDQEWAWTFAVGGKSECVTANTGRYALPWEDTSKLVPLELAFSTSKAQLRLNIDAWEKDASGRHCIWEHGDDSRHRMQDNVPFDLLSLPYGQSTGWSKTLVFLDRSYMSGDQTCSTTIEGQILKRDNNYMDGGPLIKSASVAVASNLLRLTIDGKDLHPDPQELPVVQITGVKTECIAGSIQASATQISCTLVKPESAKVSLLELQVQVQTRFGLSRSAKASFPACPGDCQNGGTCWWSKDRVNTECVCLQGFHGAQCQNKYAENEPELFATAPLGVDITLARETVIALIGVVIPKESLAMTGYCVISGGESRAGTTVVNGEVIEEPPVWEGPVVNYDGRPVAQSDSLTISGLCIMPAGHLAAWVRDNDASDVSHLKVAVVWRGNSGGGLSRRSKVEGTFNLYGPLDLESSIVEAVANEADGREMRVLREQSVRVSLLDNQGRNRVGGEDGDLFFLDFFAGPSAQPQVGVNGGVAKQFRYAACQTKSERDLMCAYYELTMSFDFAGTYKAHVMAFDSAGTQLVQLREAITFNVIGFGDMALPVPSMSASSISWAKSLGYRDRGALPLFDKNLAQTVSPNTGAADRLGVLEGLFERIQGKWFSQRQTVSVAFESGPSQVSMGSVHTVHAQGIDEPYFCDTHTDELKAGVMTRSLKPWDKVGNVPRSFALSSMGVSQTECLSSVTVNVVLVHSSPQDVRITLTRLGKQSALPKASDISTTVVLKDFGKPTNAQQFNESAVPGLASLAGRPVRANWALDVQHRAGKGFVRDWWLDFASDNCLTFQGANAICGFGPGQLYARAPTDADEVHLECPAGGIISEIVWARYGRIEGSCEEATTNPLTVHDACEAAPATVRKRVASACVGKAKCVVSALDELYGKADPEAENEFEPFLCADELVECREDRSLLAERSSRRQARHESREHHAQAHMAPVTYPGTEDHYFKSTTVRHHTEPFFRPRQANGDGSSNNNGSVVVVRGVSMECSSEPRVKKALMVQARCKDANAAFKHTDTPAVAKKMVMASVSADLDNDWKDEVVTLFGYEGGALHASFTWVGADGEPTTAVVRDLAVGGSAVVLGEGGHIEMATGDFDSDGYPELAFGFVDASSTGGKLRVFMWDLRMESTEVWGTAVAKANLTDLQPCLGCFADSAKLHSLFATAVELQLPGSPTYPIVLTGAAAAAAGVESGSRLDSGGFAFSLAAGKVNALPSMLAVTWIVDRSTVSWALFRRTSQSSAAMVSASPHSLVSLRQPHAVAVNLGDYEGSGLAELALGIVDDNEVTLYLYAINELTLDSSLPMTLQKSLVIAEAPWWETAQYNLRMVSGDMNNDGDDEIVVAFTSATEGIGSQAEVFRVDSATCFRLECLELVGSFAFVLPSGPTASGSVENAMTARSPEIKLAIGNVDESLDNELLVAFEYSPSIASGSHKVMLTSLTAQPDPDRPFVINGRQCYAGPAYQRSEDVGADVVNNMALSVGNLYGLGYRVGQTIKVRFESVPELIAVINAPPTHFDIIDGKEVVVNTMTFTGYGSSTRLSNAEGVTSSFEISRDLVHVSSTSRAVVADATVSVVVSNVRVQSQEVKKRAEAQGQSTMEQISVSRELVASGDDVVLYMSTTRDLWKFPIVDQSGTQVGSLDIWASSSCGEDCVQKGDGRDLWWFTPDHEPFNVLTYSARAPEDFNPANRIMVGEKVTLGPNEHMQSVSQRTGKSEKKMALDHTTSSTSHSEGYGADVTLSAWYAMSPSGTGPQQKIPVGTVKVRATKGTAEDEENAGDTKSEQIAAIERDVSVQCYVEPINPEYAYRVQPFVWTARAPDGREYLKVDYTAEPGYYPGVSTWWERTYSKPDPAFNLPWWWTTFKRDRTMLTKEMVATPAVPVMRQVVEVTVTVRNKALVDARNVDVALWRGSPDNCLDEACLLDDNALIGMATVGLIPSQGKREVSFRFIYTGVQNIHATIDDNDALAEMHEDNNHAYSLLFHDIANSGYTLQTLRLDPALTLSPVVASDGSGLTTGYHVKAKVLGDTFTRANVLVQLWHGNVGGDAGGRLIGTVLVPRVDGSTNATTSYEVSVFWETRNPALYGKQELHAVILHSGFSTDAANVIAHVSQTVSVACYGRVDQCGVCGGNNRTCAGCDGVALSGKTVDACGACGGTGSTCCIPKPAQAQWHHVRIDDSNIINANSNSNSTNGSSTAVSDLTSWSSMVTRARVGDLVVWENLLNWEMKIVSGAYDYKGAPAVELPRFNQGPVTETSDLLDDAAIEAYLKEHMSMMRVKDFVARPTSAQAVAPPATDSTSDYLRRSAGDHQGKQNHQSTTDLFPGWRTNRPSGSATFDVLKRSQAAQGLGVDEESVMAGVCCAQEAETDHDTATMGDYDDGEQADRLHEAGVRRSLRVSVVAKLVEAKLRLDHLASLANSTGVVLPAMEEAMSQMTIKARFAKEQVSSPAVRCLCRRESSECSDLTCVNRPSPDAGALYPGLYSFAPIMVTSEDPSAVLAPGAASMPHRFFSPGLYVWHDSNNPVIHGVVVVAPSELQVDVCGVCNGDGTSCLDCLGTPIGTARVDACGVCSDPLAPGWVPNPAIDCTGMCNGTAVIDDCDQCSGGTTGRVHNEAMDCSGACHGSSVIDCMGVCNGGLQLDCLGICNGPGIMLDGLCLLPSKRSDQAGAVEEGAVSCAEDGAEVDCMGVCNGPARLNPCGLCVAPADYDRGEGYWVDCAGTCRGTAQIGDCGICVGGRSGHALNAHKDCQGTCFGNATRDECGVCFVEGDGHVVNSGKDCTGMCGGKAVVDECGQCVLGTTGREFNGAKDCVGECFGGRLPTDPTCHCEREELDKCFVCGGDNSKCAGCDGVPNSGAVHDLCGVCGGDNSTCCFLPFAQATVVIRDFDTMILPVSLDAGENLLVTNLHDSTGYTFQLASPVDSASSSRKLKIVAQYPRLLPGNSLRVVVTEPGEYVLKSAESSAVSIQFSVRFNRKTRDSCDRCVYSDAENNNSNREAYDHCCEVMESKDDVHAWFETTHFHAATDPEVVTRVAAHTSAYRSAPTRHLLRLLEPQVVEWSAADQRLAVGDVVVFENRDLLDHVIAITGPQPMPDVVLDRGTVAVAGPVLMPGTYRVVSRSNLINTTFTVEFGFACTVHAHEEPQSAGRYHVAVSIGLTLAGSLTLMALLAAVMVKLYRRRNEATRGL